jgi:dimethylsulfone monooxygenase
LNVVCGWYSQELRMFGLPPMDHDMRYAYAEEWLEVVRKLWTAKEEFDYSGRFFTIDRGVHLPKPLQQPHPPIMNAGSSAIGARFAAKHADMAFIGLSEDGLDAGKAQIDDMRRIGRQDFGREFQIWTSCRVVCRPTEREARDMLGSRRPCSARIVSTHGRRLGRLSVGRHSRADRRRARPAEPSGP